MTKYLVMIPLLLGFVVLTACSSGLQAVADAEANIPKGITVVANTLTDLVQQNQVTPDEAQKVQTLLSHVLAGNVHAVAATKAITALNSTTKPQISQILAPIIQEVDSAITSGDVAQIKNQQAKLAIVVSFAALQSTLQIIASKVK